MKTSTFRQLLLYNYRYIFAYLLMAGFIAYFLFWQLGSVAPGLSQAEVHNAAIHTNALQSLQTPINPVFSKLQIFSLKVLDINSYTIRIPSVLLALTSLLMLFQILKKWFGRPTALLSVLLVCSADWFLFAARHANGGIELSFWLVVVLFATTKVIEHKSQWLMVLAGAVTALLFVPFGAYAATVICVGLFGSKVLRQRILEASVTIKVLSVLLVILMLGYLGFTIVRDTSIAAALLGVSSGIPTLSQYGKQLLTNGPSTVAVLPAMSPLNGPNGVFFVRFFELTFVLFGVFMFWKTRINRLNLVVIALAIVLFFASGLSVADGASSLLIVPSIIFITAGVRYFMHRWQKTFPKNPYARLAAFVPVILLLFVTMIAHHQSYFVLWPHQTTTRAAFTYDLKLAQDELAAVKTDDCLVISNDEDLQTLIKESNGYDCALSQTNALEPVAKNQTQLVQPTQLGVQAREQGVVQKAVVSDQSEGALRWVVRTRLTPTQ